MVPDERAELCPIPGSMTSVPALNRVKPRATLESGERNFLSLRYSEDIDLVQRKKGRDLFDLWLALGSTGADPDRVVDCFRRHMDHEGTSVSRAQFEANLSRKLGDRSFVEDKRFLIPAYVGFARLVAARLVQCELIARLPRAFDTRR